MRNEQNGAAGVRGNQTENLLVLVLVLVLGTEL
jgi:hypothetical protein